MLEKGPMLRQMYYLLVSLGLKFSNIVFGMTGSQINTGIVGDCTMVNKEHMFLTVTDATEF